MASEEGKASQDVVAVYVSAYETYKITVIFACERRTRAGREGGRVELAGGQAERYAERERGRERERNPCAHTGGRVFR